MAIEFHCEHCGKMIKTAKEHGGKQGKCPYCQKMVYIPVPDDELEPLKLAPLDPEAERKRQQLLDETRDLTRRIRREKGTLPPEPAKAPLPEPTGDVRLKTDMDTLVVEYVACMAAGNLSEAQEYAAEIRQEYGFKQTLALVDANKVAREVLGVPIVNTTMIGALLRATGVVQVETMEVPLKDRFGALAVKNFNALKVAYEQTTIEERRS